MAFGWIQRGRRTQMPGSGLRRRTHAVVAAATVGTKLGLEKTTPLLSSPWPPSGYPSSPPTSSLAKESRGSRKWYPSSSAEQAGAQLSPQSVHHQGTNLSHEGTFLRNKLTRASLGGWRRRHRGKDPRGASKRILSRLTMGEAVQAEHGRIGSLGVRERVWLGGSGSPHKVDGVAS